MERTGEAVTKVHVRYRAAPIPGAHGILLLGMLLGLLLGPRASRGRVGPGGVGIFKLILLSLVLGSWMLEHVVWPGTVSNCTVGG